MYVFGVPAAVAPELPVFSDPWDLNSAVRLSFNDSSLRAYPVVVGALFSCQADYIKPHNLSGIHGNFAVADDERPPSNYAAPYYERDHRAWFGHAVFLDVVSGRSQLLRNRLDCLTALREFNPAALYLPASP